MIDLTHEAHKKRHEELHAALDELVADWIMQTKLMPNKSSVLDLMKWSASQVDNPTEQEK